MHGGPSTSGASFMAPGRSMLTSMLAYAALLLSLAASPLLASEAAVEYGSGQVHLKTGNFEWALRAFERAAALEPRNKKSQKAISETREAAVRSLLRELERLPKPSLEQMAGCLRECEKWSPDSARAARLRSQILKEIDERVTAIRSVARRGDLEAARGQAEELLPLRDLDPRIDTVTSELAALGGTAGLSAAGSNSRSTTPRPLPAPQPTGSAEDYFRQGKAHLDGNSFEAAIEAFSLAATIEPTSGKFVKALAKAKARAVDGLLERLAADSDTTISEKCDCLKNVREWQPEDPRVRQLWREVEEQVRGHLTAANLKSAAGEYVAARALVEGMRSCGEIVSDIRSTAHNLDLREALIGVRRQLADGDVENAFKTVRRLKGEFPGSSLVQEVEPEARRRWEEKVLELADLRGQRSSLDVLEAILPTTLAAAEACPECSRVQERAAQLLSSYRAELDSFAERYRSSDGSASAMWARCMVFDRGLKTVGPRRSDLLNGLCESGSAPVRIAVAFRSESAPCIEGDLLREVLSSLLPAGSPIEDASQGQPWVRSRRADLLVTMSVSGCELPRRSEGRVEQVSSSYVAGYQQIANPAYASLQTQLISAQQEAARLELSRTINPNDIVANAGLLAVNIRLASLRVQLQKTPPYLDRPVEQPYVFDRFQESVRASVAGTVEVTDPTLSLVLMRRSFQDEVARTATGVRGVAEQDTHGNRNVLPALPSDADLITELQSNVRADLTEKLGVAVARWPLERTRKALSDRSLPAGAGFLAASRVLASALPTELRSRVERELGGTGPADLNELQAVFDRVEPLVPVYVEESAESERGVIGSRPAPRIEELRKAVVVLRAGDRGGSGFVVNATGLILTNAHVVGRSATVEVETYAGDLLLGRVIERSEAADLALVKVEFPGTPWLQLAGAGQVRLAQEIYIIGAPSGLEGTVTKGIVSAIRQLAGFRVIQVDAAISPGSSGGPVIDETGRVIGIVTSKLTNAEALGFAVAADEVPRALPGLRSSH